MSPVDRAGPVTEISPHSYFLCKNFDAFNDSRERYELLLFESHPGNRAGLTRVLKATSTAAGDLNPIIRLALAQMELMW